jgi:mRNA interferase MazF
MLIKRGDIFFAQLNPVVGSEQGGTRPVLVIQNNIGNQYSPTTIVGGHYFPDFQGQSCPPMWK